MNRNYISGRNLEYDVTNYIRELGGLAVRSAGSKTPIDVIAFFTDELWIIQCKKYSRTKPNPEKEFIKLKVPSYCKKYWITKKKGQKGFDKEKVG